MIDRLDRAYLRRWREDYENIRASYLRGEITLFDAIKGFRNLGFKDDALTAEWLSLEREKNKTTQLSTGGSAMMVKPDTGFVLEIDCDEMAVRMAEAVAEMRRPPECKT